MYINTSHNKTNLEQNLFNRWHSVGEVVGDVLPHFDFVLMLALLHVARIVSLLDDSFTFGHLTSGPDVEFLPGLFPDFLRLMPTAEVKRFRDHSHLVVIFRGQVSL